MMELNYGKIRKYCIVYITLPVIIFLMGWLKPQFSVVAALLIMGCAYLVFKQKEESQKRILISWKMLLVLGILALVWCFFAGQGGYYYQSPDHDCRNAILRDLINFKWPVIYEKYDAAMVYYIGYWMPAALIGKVVLLITHSANAAWLVGNFALLIWSTVGILLVFLLLIYSVNANTKKKMIAACFLFIFFSGLDVVGEIAFNQRLYWHIEWWSGIYQYSSITTCLFWVFNQAVIPWIVILCLINEKSVKNYAFIGVMCLPSGPFPFLGIFIYCIFLGIKFGIDAIKAKKLKRFLKEIASPQNVFICLIIVPIYFVYYTSNAAVSSSGESGGLCFFWEEISSSLLYDTFKYIMFFILEAGVYAFVIYRKNKKNILFYITVFSLMLIALFRMCNSADFAMRVSIPAIAVLGYMVIDYLINNFNDRKSQKAGLRCAYALLVTIYILGSVTPVIEFARGIDTVIENKKINMVCDDIVTFNQVGRFTNFITYHYSEKIFFKYLSR